MVKGIFWLVLAYGLSQFYRACLAVFGPVLKLEIGLGADDTSTALGLWFLTFAAMQIPVGWLLDHRSPKATAMTLLAFGGGLGAIVFAMAQGPLGVSVAMMLIGVGCSPVLMTSLYIIARTAPPARFGTLAGLVLGIGSLGNVAAATPLTWSMELLGWRGTLLALAALTLLIAGALYRFVQDPPRLEHTSEGPRKGMRDLLKLRALYPILLIAMVAYAPGGGLRGSWIGGYLSDVHGLSPAQVGTGTLVMALAMIIGSLAFGPMDRLIKSHKWIVGGSAALTLVPLVMLWWGFGDATVTVAIVLFALVGFFSSNYPQIMNHGRTLLPPELVGRGVTLINLFSIGGVGLSQIASARLFAAQMGDEGAMTTSYSIVFGFFAVTLVMGLAVYVFGARDPR
ncbi:MFS transporter [Celeribacter baekdonensis]|uniref:MFS transporter n=1 Tax=Celeribacter baekdonensis TaxID=875171 RepID=UPI003A94A0BE